MSQTFSFELDMDKSRRSPQMVAARVGDMGSIHIDANLVFNGAAYTPTGQNAYFECITNADTSVRVQAQKSGSTVSVDIPSQALCKPGVITCAYFRFENGTTENPTFVESTQSFGIIVPTSIDDNIDAEDYLGEWRALEQQLQGYVDEVSAAATQAKKDISSDTSAVESAKSSAISSINADKQEVADAAADVMKPINDVLAQFNEDSQDAIDSFNSKGTSAIGAFNSSSANAVSQFNTKGNQAVNSFNTKGNQAVSTFNANGTQKIQEFDDAADTKLASVDKMISQAQSDVDADIAALQKATQDAIDAMEAALSEDQYGEILQRLNRVWKLSHQDMTAITNGQDLNSFKSVGCYVCQTNAAAQTLQNKPEDLSVAFFLYVLSISSTGSNQYYTQLIIPYKPAAGKMKFFTRSFDLNQNTWDEWAEVGSGADITAGEGIIVTGDDTKQVALDPDAFHESIEGAELASFDTSVTGGGSVQEMVVYGNTSQNLWVNPSGTSKGLTVTGNEDGSCTISGTSTDALHISCPDIYTIKPNTKYTVSIDKTIEGSVEVSDGFAVVFPGKVAYYLSRGARNLTFTSPESFDRCICAFHVNAAGRTFSGTYRVMLNEGGTAKPWCPPGLNSVDELSIVTAGKNLAPEKFQGVVYTAGKSAAVNAEPVYYMPEQTVTASFYKDGVKVPEGRSSTIAIYLMKPDGSDTILSLTNYNPTGVISSTSDISGYIARMFANSYFSDTDCIISVQLELGSTATDYEPPNITTTPIDLQGHTLNSLPNGTRDELHIDGGGNVVLEKRVYRSHVEADGFIAQSKEYSEMSFGTGCDYVHGVKFVSKSQRNDFAPVENADIQSGSPRASVFTLNRITYFRVGDGTVQASAQAQLESVKSKVGTKGIDVMWALLEPQTIQLGKIYLSPVSSSQLNVWVDGSSNGTGFTPPVTVDVVANKVDYRLPQPVDLSSKEDAFDVLPVSKGGTGTASAQAERNRLGLGNTTGALPIANGGTGSTSAANARSALGITPANIGAAPASHTHSVSQVTGLGSAAQKSISSTTKTRDTVAYVGVDGVMEVGAHIDFHNNESSKDYDGRISVGASNFSMSKPLAIGSGGTGATTGPGAFSSLASELSTQSSGDISSVIANASGGGYIKYTLQALAKALQQYIGAGGDIDASDITSGVLAVARGGTGVTSAQAERNRLGLGNTTGALPVANGGTGATSASNAANAILGGITGSTNTLGSTAEFFIDDGGVPSRLEYLTLVSDIGVRLLGNSTSNAQVKFLTVGNVGGTLAGVASNVYEFIYDCDNDGNEFLCLAKFTATIAGQSFNVGLVGRLEKDLSNGGPTIYMSGIGWPTSVDSVSDNGAGLLLVHAFTKVTRTSMSFNASSLYFLGIKVMTTSSSWPPPSSYSIYGARYNSNSFSFNRMLLLGYDSKMVV